MILEGWFVVCVFLWFKIFRRRRRGRIVEGIRIFEVSRIIPCGAKLSEVVAEFLESGVHSGFDGAEGDIEGFSDLFVGEMLVLVEDEDGTDGGG